MVGQKWRSIYYNSPAQLYGIETSKCNSTAIIVQLYQKQIDRREGDQAGATSEKVNKREKGGHGNE
jgi:hypothetical protein